ncbi:HAD family hydrolase [uncultured Thiothrix sp.]|uniref:HAD family hydrolase n=1 Tax=uncultured Thiothrix sp. TaxID=223185 RepID=UPI00261160F9|nr:HAD family hydrolase [uncultured Thiothrix sp.]
MTIRCIAFDLDDTLWDCQSVIEHAEQTMYRWLQAYYPVISQRYPSLDSLVASRIAYVGQYPELHHDLTTLRTGWLQQLLVESAYDPAYAEQAFQVFWQARNQVTFFPEVLPSLERLAQSYSLGVITNGNADVHHIGIGHLFEFALNSAEAGVAKPHPAIFQQALNKLQLEPHQMVYVGDDPEKDVIGAQQVGLRTIWFNAQQRERPLGLKPDAIMTNFAEIEALLKLL